MSGSNFEMIKIMFNNMKFVFKMVNLSIESILRD